MIEQKNERIIEKIIEAGLWIGPLCYVYQWDGEEMLTTYTHIT